MPITSSIPLAAKLDQARELLAQALHAHGPDRIAVAWTGGKDSTLALALWREVLAAHAPDIHPKALTIDTGCKFPEILAFRDQLTQAWDLDLHVARPTASPVDFQLPGQTAQCCAALKVQPLRKAILDLGLACLVTGIRADEHPSRASLTPQEHFDGPPHTRLHPILHLREIEVWSAHMQDRLPYCALYDQGYRSLGCQPCTAPPAAHLAPGLERAGRSQAKEQSMEQLRALGYF